MKNRSVTAVLLSLCVAVPMILAGCGSGGGSATPPPPQQPMNPPPQTPAPDPTPADPTTAEGWIEHYKDLDTGDDDEINGCRARTPGFNALAGWLSEDDDHWGSNASRTESRVWIRDDWEPDPDRPDSSHGKRVSQTFTDCTVALRDGFVQLGDSSPDSVEEIKKKLTDDPPTRDLLISASASQAGEGGLDWFNLDNEIEQEVMLIVSLGNGNGNATSLTECDDTGCSEYATSLKEALNTGNVDSALWILVGGYTGEGDSRRPAPARQDSAGNDIPFSGSSTCGDTEALCLFAPWNGSNGGIGTSHSTPQVSAALDTVWAVWPEMKILDLRNLAFDCAKNMGEKTNKSTFTYSNGNSIDSYTNSTWGHGILSLECLFTPAGGLENPVTGDPISGGIYGPVAGPVTGASITGFDYTGRDFGYGFARPVVRPNYALAATANLRPAQAISRPGRPMAGAAAFSGSLWRSGAFGVDLTAAGNAIGAAAGWQAGNWTLRGGLAFQPEGAGSLTGSRAFRAPATASAAITAAYAKGLRGGFSVHLQADHWRTLAAQGRSLWENAELSESRISAGLARRAGRHEVALQTVWQSGVRGALRVAGRDWRLAGIRESGVWLTWGYR